MEPDGPQQPTPLNPWQQPGPQQPGRQQPWPQQPRPGRRNPAVVVPLALVALVGAVLAGYLVISGLGGGGGEKDEIRKTVKEFAHAVDRNDNVTLLSMLCPQEAAGVADDIDSPDGRGDPKAKLIPITVEDIKINGNIAEVHVTRPRQKPATLFLRKEKGVWKLCDTERYNKRN